MGRVNDDTRKLGEVFILNSFIHREEQLIRRGAPPAEVNRSDEVLDPEALTLGFARRFDEPLLRWELDKVSPAAQDR